MSGRESPDTTRKLDALTGLRFFAAFWVVAFHYGLADLPGVPGPVAELARKGDLGVTLFYVLSGFILTYTYARVGEPTAIDARAFWVNRLARVYPLHVVALVVTFPFFVEEMRGRPWGAAWAAGAFVVTLLQAWTPQTVFLWNFPSWTLSNEAFFYLTYPRLLRGLTPSTRRGAIGWAATAWLTSLVVPTLYFLVASEHGFGLLSFDSFKVGELVVFTCPLFRLPEFVLGIAFGMHFLHDRDAPRPGRLESASTWLAPLLVGAIAASVVWHHHAPALVRFNLNALSLVFAMLIYLLAFGNGPLVWVLSRPSVVFLGEASYAVYLLHVPLGKWAGRLVFDRPDGSSPATWGAFATTSLVLTAISCGSYVAIEGPSRRWIRRRFSGGGPTS